VLGVFGFLVFFICTKSLNVNHFICEYDDIVIYPQRLWDLHLIETQTYND
jgi:hypothetical protein